MNNRIKELRKSFGMTQEEFANRLAITKASVSRIESGINSFFHGVCDNEIFWAASFKQSVADFNSRVGHADEVSDLAFLKIFFKSRIVDSSVHAAEDEVGAFSDDDHIDGTVQHLHGIGRHKRQRKKQQLP